MIEPADIETLKNYFVSKDDCTANQHKIEEDVSDIKTCMAVIQSQLKFMQWLGGAVGVAVIGVAVKFLFGG